MRELTNKNWVVQCSDGVRLFINDDQKERLLQGLKVGVEHIEVDGRILPKNFGIYKPSDLEDCDKIKRGMWKCRANNWHSKFDTCECMRR